MKNIYDKNPNPFHKEWVSAISEMYLYRCAIVHDGATDTSSLVIDDKKLMKFYLLTCLLNTRVKLLLINAIEHLVTDKLIFWDDFVPKSLYSDDNIWVKNGTLNDTVFIKLDPNNIKENLIFKMLD
jgi:hypothetical protein